MSWFTDKKVVVPIDFGDRSRDAIDTAMKIVGNPANVHVIHVAPDLTAISPEIVWQGLTDDVRRENVREAFHREFGDLEAQGVTLHVAFGDPGHEVVDYAEKNNSDLIVMPSHGRTGLKRLLIGSVAERVLRLAHCPVLVLRN